MDKFRGQIQQNAEFEVLEGGWRNFFQAP